MRTCPSSTGCSTPIPRSAGRCMRDMTHEPADVVAAERARVATEGWGAQLLALQAPDGLWAGNAFSQDRTDTFHVTGAPAAARARSRERAGPAGGRARPRARHLGRGARFETHRGRTTGFFEGEVEPCINGNVVSTGSYFGVDMTPLVDRLLGEQLPDGGWNCEVERGATVSSFGTTINVLEGLLEHERAIGGSDRVGEARRRGEAYMLERRLFRRKSTGEVIDPELAPVLVPDLVALRRPARPRLPARRRGRARRAHRRGDRGRRRPAGTPTAAGRSRTSTRARRTSRWRTARASRAAGTRSAPCACSTGPAPPAMQPQTGWRRERRDAALRRPRRGVGRDDDPRLVPRQPRYRDQGRGDLRVAGRCVPRHAVALG